MIPIKSPAEIEKMRAAGQLAGEILGELAGMVRPGVTTGEIDQAAARLIKEGGAKSAFLGYRGFPGQICISMNEEIVHGIGGPRRIQYGDVAKIDVGVIKDGFIGDTALSVRCGVPDPQTDALLTETEDILEGLIPMVTEGRRLGDICHYVQQRAESAGYNVVREFVGHGVGRRMHEEPQIPNYGRKGTGPKLKAGMTLAIEPMVNLGTAEVKILEDQWTVVTADRLPSAHFEHTILVTKDEPEVLTCRRKTLLK